MIVYLQVSNKEDNDRSSDYVTSDADHVFNFNPCSTVHQSASHQSVRVPSCVSTCAVNDCSSGDRDMMNVVAAVDDRRLLTLTSHETVDCAEFNLSIVDSPYTPQ